MLYIPNIRSLISWLTCCYSGKMKVCVTSIKNCICTRIKHFC